MPHSGNAHPRSRVRAERVTVDELHRARTELSKFDQEGADAETVPILLALEIGYDIALLEVAQRNGIQSDPSRFEQPQQERERLEGALRDRGIMPRGVVRRLLDTRLPLYRFKCRLRPSVHRATSAR